MINVRNSIFKFSVIGRRLSITDPSLYGFFKGAVDYVTEKDIDNMIDIVKKESEEIISFMEEQKNKQHEYSSQAVPK